MVEIEKVLSGLYFYKVFVSLRVIHNSPLPDVCATSVYPYMVYVRLHNVAELREQGVVDAYPERAEAII